MSDAMVAASSDGVVCNFTGLQPHAARLSPTFGQDPRCSAYCMTSDLIVARGAACPSRPKHDAFYLLHADTMVHAINPRAVHVAM